MCVEYIAISYQELSDLGSESETFLDFVLYQKKKRGCIPLNFTGLLLTPCTTKTNANH